MNSEGRALLRLEAATDWLPRWLAVVFPFSIAGSVLGQQYLVPPPGFQGAPSVPLMGVPNGSVKQPAAPANQQIYPQGNPEANNGQANAPANGQPNGQSEGQPGETTATPAAAPVQSLMQWGALHLRARASYQFLYASGVHSGPGESGDTFTHTFSPGVTIAVGPHVSLDYSPSFRFYSQRDFHDTIDQSVSLSAGAGYGDWSFGVAQGYSRVDEPSLETSSQTDTENYTTSLSAGYQYNDRISFNTSGSIGLTVIGSGNSSTNVFGSGTNAVPSILADSQSYSGSEAMNYRFDEKLTGGLSVTVGYSEQNGGFRSLNEQYQGQVTWHPGNKLSAFLSGGIEDEQFLNTGAPDIVTPILSASISYHLLEQTTLSLLASRGVNASLFQSVVTETTQLGLGLQQRLLGQLQLALGFGYGTSDYKTTTAKLVTARSDETISYTAGLSLPFLKHGSFGVFYDYTQNTSSDTGFGISSSQGGATLSWAY